MKSQATQKNKVFIAMSGGVDSSVAALLLAREGHDVTGVHMLCWEGCENSQDKQDAMRVSAKLGIPFLVWDFRHEYKKAVYDYMVKEYAAGRTPNPDVMCNSHIKFGVFLKKALVHGADYIATGHYVRKSQITNHKSQTSSKLQTINHKLLTARDANKDQSYFLCRLTQEQLRHTLFPIGDYLKSEVREIAREANLPVAEKKDSQGLCFVGKVDFREFLKEVLPKEEGLVVNSRGEILGKHDGAVFYTPGQRHGLNIGGREEPLYVAERQIAANTIVAAEGREDPILYKNEVGVGGMNWIAGGSPDMPFECLARIRYRQPLQKAILYKPSTKNYKLAFNEPQYAPAPGQFAVFYSEFGEMFGGGSIEGGVVPGKLNLSFL